MKLVPSGLIDETSVSCTPEFVDEAEEYITSSFVGKVPAAPVVELIVAVQLEKVKVPKLARWKLRCLLRASLLSIRLTAGLRCK